MSVLDLIMPTHARLAEGRINPPLLGTGDRELDDALVAVMDMARDGDWPAVRHLGEAIAHRAKILGYRQTCDAEGVVRR